MPLLAISCIALSFLIGYYGRDRKMGFWGYFFASLLLTPFIGALLVIVSDKKKTAATRLKKKEIE